jgi:hypothetical protein
MTTQAKTPPMSAIGKAQNEESNLRRYLAAAHFYRFAKWVHFGGASLTVALALASPLVLFFKPSLGPTLGAIAGAWILLSRLILEPLKRQFQLRGATAQELFDCAVLGLDWNDSLARRLPEEEIRAASGAMKGVDKVRDWYPATKEIAWPTSVLVCQRSNAVWARRQHAAYARAVGVAAWVWMIFGIVIAVIHHATLGEYLVTIALPSLPALLDASELSRGHAAAANRRQLLEDQTNALMRDASASGQQLREVQDQLFNLRVGAPLVPEWFYNLIRPKYEEDMRYSADRVANHDSDGVSGET